MLTAQCDVIRARHARRMGVVQVDGCGAVCLRLCACVWPQDYGSPDDLMAALKRIASDEAAYARHMAWKGKRWQVLPQAFLAYTQSALQYKPAAACEVCTASGGRPTCCTPTPSIHACMHQTSPNAPPQM